MRKSWQRQSLLPVWSALQLRLDSILWEHLKAAMLLKDSRHLSRRPSSAKFVWNARLRKNRLRQSQ